MALGFIAAPGLLLVSAALDNLVPCPATEPATIVVHLVISLLSAALLILFVRGADRRRINCPFRGDDLDLLGGVQPATRRLASSVGSTA